MRARGLFAFMFVENVLFQKFGSVNVQRTKYLYETDVKNTFYYMYSHKNDFSDVLLDIAD